MTPNRRILLARRPTGIPDDSCWTLVEDELPAPGDGQVLVKVTHLSVDPAQRAWLDENAYFPPVPVGDTMRALGVGEVVESRYEKLAPGDAVHGALGVQEHALLPGPMLRRIDEKRVPPRYFASALGITGGMTAYFGMLHCGRPKQGDTVLMSTAAGSVGSLAGQIARIHGCRVIGIAGGPEKCRYVTETLHFDDCIDYKNENVHDAIRAKAPDGLDVYFDNVGGEILDDALDQLKQGARVVLCGAITQYNQRAGDDRRNVRGPSMYLRIAERNAIMEGFTANRFAAEFPKAEADLAGWIADGQIHVREHIEHGVERFPAVLRMLFEGSHYGKLLLSP